MNNLVLLTIMIVLLGCNSPKKQLDNTFYVFNNCSRTLPNAPETMDEQAKLVKELGYDGFGGHTSDDYWKRRKALDKVGLKMPEIYWGMKLTDEGKLNYNEEIKEIIKDSKDRGLLVSLLITGENMAGDKLVVEEIQKLAEFSAPFGVKIAVYPHANTFVETLAHSVNLAKMIDRQNVGAIFNTCHFLKVEGEDGWDEKLLNALPYLYMISISGADSGNTQKMGWDLLIQPLGEGTFDTYKLVKLAKDNGYEGPFGLQCYNIKQDCELALTKSMDTWERYKERYAEE